MKYSIRQATPRDEQDLKAVLVQNGQKSTIVLGGESVYYVAVTREGLAGVLAAEAAGPAGADEVVGLVGAEMAGPVALIRSLAVLAPHRGNGIANELVGTLLQELGVRGVVRIYLFSRDTGGYWGRLGFAGCDVREVIGQLPDAPQVAGYVLDGSIWTDVAWRRDLSPVILSPG